MEQLIIQCWKTDICRPYGTTANFYLTFNQHNVPNGTIKGGMGDFDRFMFIYVPYFVTDCTVPERMNIGRKNVTNGLIRVP